MAHAASSSKKKNDVSDSLSGFKKFRKDWIEPLVVAFFLAMIIRSFLFAPFKIPSGSMEDTLLVGDQFMAIKFHYGLRLPFANKFLIRYRDPKPGEIIVFRGVEDPSKDLIKRCIAVGGQNVKIQDKKVYVDDKLQQFPEHVKFLYQDTYPIFDHYGPKIVPENHIFFLGDNRHNSNDSRFWGFVPYENMIGKAYIIWWSWNPDAPFYDIFHKVRWKRLFTIIR